jgi:hypothetical protein
VLSQVDSAAEVIAGHPAGFDVTAPVGFDKIRVLAATAQPRGRIGGKSVERW